MEDNYKSVRRKTSSELYEQYISGDHNKGNKGIFENKSNFRSDLSKYNNIDRTIQSGTSCKWDKINCAGVPLDYSPENNCMFVDGSDAHTLIIGATGSKKSRLIVMPTVRILAAAKENMIICDPKGEIYRRCSGFLQDNGYNIHAINLREPQKGDGWNMLAVPYEAYKNQEIDKACEYINDMTINLVSISSKDPYWDYSARDMLFGLIILLFSICYRFDLPDNIVNMQNVLRLREELFCSTSTEIIQNTVLWKFAKTDELIRMRLNGIVICPTNTLSCIISVFDQHMSCFLLQPQVMEMLSESTFDVHDFGFGRNAFFIVMPDEKTTFHKVVTVFIKQVYELLIENAYKKTKNNRFPSRINFILDEFSSLPTVSDFPQMIAASRSRNIRFMLIVQSKHQLKQRYGEETSTIMSNCSNWMFLTSREIELLREISEMSGTTGSNREQLISISKLQHLNKDQGECLIFNGRKYPYFAKLPDIEVYESEKEGQLDMKTREKKLFNNLKDHYFRDVVSAYFINRK